MGCFNLVRFSKWPDYSQTKSPQLNENELIEVMRTAASFASVVGVRVCFLDNAIWLLCAKSGLYFNNNSLARFVQDLVMIT